MDITGSTALEAGSDSGTGAAIDRVSDDKAGVAAGASTIDRSSDIFMIVAIEGGAIV